ncbi:hypothetical protein [Lentzea sp. NPDC060358]|uniref:hypothetical protein n=1 Tax=Lentzea sp. NPDC060358 TaxID=3347103 RepID=UPI0036583566
MSKVLPSCSTATEIGSNILELLASLFLLGATNLTGRKSELDSWISVLSSQTAHDTLLRQIALNNNHTIDGTFLRQPTDTGAIGSWSLLSPGGARPASQNEIATTWNGIVPGRLAQPVGAVQGHKVVIADRDRSDG